MTFAFPIKPLSEIADAIDYGVTASASAIDTGTRFLRITDIQDGGVDWATVPYCDAPPNKLRSATLADGDIVFARTGATTGKSFLIKSPPSRAVFASYLIRVKPSTVVDSGYLAHFFQSQGYWGQIDKRTRGAAQGGVNATSLSEIEIPLPPLPDQRRIAAILDKADALRRKRKRAIELLDSLTQSIFLEMFGRMAPAAKLADVCDRVTDGTHQAPNWSPSGIPFLFVSNVRNQHISYETTKFVSEAEYDRLTKNVAIEVGDVLYTAVGSYGHAAEIVAPAKFIFQRHVAHIKPNKTKVDPSYLSHALEAPDARRQADKTARGNAQKTVTLDSLKRFLLPLPPLDRQKEFAAKARAIQKTLCVEMANLDAFDALFASLQSRAFSGQL